MDICAPVFFLLFFLRAKNTCPFMKREDKNAFFKC